MDPVERVKNMVRHSLVASPNVSNTELLERAKEIAPQAVDGLSLRQFHAKFRLPIVRHEMIRRRPPGERPKPRPKPTPAAPSLDAPPEATVDTTAEPRAPKRQREQKQPDALAATGIRRVLLEFAVDLEKAEGRGDLIRVAGDIDTYVGRILEITRNGHG